MNQDRVDSLINRLYVVCLSLGRLRTEAAYQDQTFRGLLEGFLHHSRELMDLIRAREGVGLKRQDGKLS